MISYVLTSGSYSDYGIIGVFSTKKKAELFVAESRRLESEERGGRDYSPPDDMNIEEYEIDLPPLIRWIEVKMTKGGDSETRLTSDPPRPAGEARFLYYSATGDIVFRVALDNAAGAAKSVNEKRALILASDAWGDKKRTSAVMGQDVIG